MFMSHHRDFRVHTVIRTDGGEDKPVFQSLEVEGVSEHRVFLQHVEDYFQSAFEGGVQHGFLVEVIGHGCLPTLLLWHSDDSLLNDGRVGRRQLGLEFAESVSKLWRDLVIFANWDAC